MAESFDEVMVDEYQDTNEAQDMIFRAISREEKNLFMVGDVKQSIYRFRQAMPEIFLRRKASYQPYDPQKEAYPAKVILDKNFRSRHGVTDGVNFVFRQIMSTEMGEMEYTREEELVPGASYPERDEGDTELHILTLPKGEDMDVEEAAYIGNLIASMVRRGEVVQDGGRQRPATYRDFCVLIRNATPTAAFTPPSCGRWESPPGRIRRAPFSARRRCLWRCPTYGSLITRCRISPCFPCW